MRDVSFDLLRTFLSVYRTGSVSRAAELRGVSQPTVTAHIKALEADLDRPLFDRVPRGMAPTQAADHLAARIAPAIDSLEDWAHTDLDRSGDPFGRAVHLGGPAELLCARVLPSLAHLVARGLQVRARFGMPDELLAELSGGGLDLVVSTVRPRRRGLHVEVLADEEFALVGAPAWTAEDVDRAPLVAYAENLPILRRYWRTVFDARLARGPAVVVPDLRGVLATVVAGAGITVLPTYLCAAELADGRLRLLHRPEVAPINTLFLAGRAGATHPAAVAVRGELLHRGRIWTAEVT
ncbi:LysR family transcriptional regulator [Actinomadura terrae]|uniref:LysR family transcriptional regulator n=1 Tax=Actinomadura terrae TaxID=604353 RepID=UPI001FA79AE6|nr:LysR family transcriptional regulator [Actinomadura terrae]